MIKLSRLLCIALCFGVVACGSPEPETPADAGPLEQVLHYGNGAEPQDLDPHVVTGVPENHILSALMEGLVSSDPKDLSPTPGMAESWEVSEDRRVYTFTIGKNRTWSNGDPCTAHDIVFSWERVLSPKLASQYAYMLFVVENAEAFNAGEITDFSQVGVKALDDHTLQVTLKAPTPYFLSLLQHYSTWPVHKPTILAHGEMDEVGTMWTRPENFVGNGGFLLKSWKVNEKIIVEKNPGYWDADKMRLEAIHFYPISVEQTEEQKFMNGELHLTNTIQTNMIPVYKEKHPEFLRIDPYFGTYYYRINVTRPPMDDVRVRRALVMSINRQLLVDKVTKGDQKPSFTFCPPNTNGYTSTLQIEENVEEAKKLLAEAGYPNGEGFPSIEILYNSSESHKIIAEALQQMWKKALNIDVTLANQDWKVYLDSQRRLQYDLSRAGWIGDYVDPNSFLDLFVTDGGNNQTGWSNAKYDEAIANAAISTTEEERFSWFQKASHELMTELPVLPLYTYTRVYLKSPLVQGWYPNYLDRHPYKYVYLAREPEGGNNGQ